MNFINFYKELMEKTQMRKLCPIIAILAVVMFGMLNDAYSQNQFRQSDYTLKTDPQPFQDTAWQSATYRSAAATSTGYLFMDAFSGFSSPVYNWKPSDYQQSYPNAPLTPGRLLSTDFEPNLWKRIYPGPRSVPASERELRIEGIGVNGNDESVEIIMPDGRMPQEGLRYFRNPAEWADYTAEFSANPIDSTVNAFAGPIPIGFAFYMNGLRYDSFYVSTCGIIALSNRRYIYDGDGRRAVPPNKSDCYDPNSADWPFVSDATFPLQYGGPTMRATASNDPTVVDMGRVHTGRGERQASLDDPTKDNYGFVHIACGGSINNKTGGIREWVGGIEMPMDGNDLPIDQPSMQLRLIDKTVSGAAYISAFEGPFYMPQSVNGVVDDHGQVWYKRSAASDKLIIYFKNFHMRPGRYVRSANPNMLYNIVEGRLYETDGMDNVLEGSVQVELNRLDSSITLRYGDWIPAGGATYQIVGVEEGTGRFGTAVAPNSFFQPHASIAVGGYARHVNYNSRVGRAGEGVDEVNPWAGQYIQYTVATSTELNGGVGQDVTTGPWHWLPDLITNNYSIKFKQWKNALRLLDVQYRMRDREPNALEFTQRLNTNAATNVEDPIELLAGHEQLGLVRPVAVIQNLTNDIQGPTGVNFVEQDFQFQANVRIQNKVTEKIIYNRIAKIADTCLVEWDFEQGNFSSPAQKAAYCGAENVVWTYVRREDANHILTNHTYDEYAGLTEDYTEERNGIPAYNFVEVTFPNFAPNENLSDQLGLMELVAFTDATHPITGARIGDEWPMDDTAKTSFWVISRVADFRSNGEYHFQRQMGTLPNITRWVHSSRAANVPSVTVVEGGATSTSSKNPLPPLGMISPMNEIAGNAILRQSPMYQFSAMYHSKLTSFPVDMRNSTGSIITLAVQKGESSLNKDRNFSDNTMVGPEARVSFMNFYESGSNMGAGKVSGFDGRNNAGEAHEPYVDFLFVEYLTPSLDGVKNITSTGAQEIGSNINNSTYLFDAASAGASLDINNTLWRGHSVYNTNSQQFGVSYAHSPALAVFGGGGYYTGWTFADGISYQPANWNNNTNVRHDDAGGSAVVYLDADGVYRNGFNITNPSETIVAGFVPNPYDVGFDDEFHRYSVVIPDYYVTRLDNRNADGGQNFRFRIRTVDVAAKLQNADGPLGAGKGVQGNPSDDNDYFFVDNVAIMKAVATPDLEAQSVRILWPYRSVPITQATNMQAIGRIANMSTADARNFNVKIRVYQGESTNALDIANAIYCQSITVPSLAKGESIELTANNLNLGEFCQNPYIGGANPFTVQMIIYTNNNDQYASNDTIYSQFNLILDTVMSYVTSNSNDVETEVALAGKGLNLGAHSIGGYMEATPGADFTPTRTGNFRLSSANWPHNGLFMNYWDNGIPRISYVSGGNIDQMFPGNSHDYISGQIAVKFEIRNTDSVRGVVAQFADANQSFDDISFNIYPNAVTPQGDDIPGQEQVQVNNPALPLLARRLYAKAANGTETLVGTKASILYEFSSPIVLTPGVYWISIDQRGETGLELAATGESMGMRTMLIHAEQDQGNTDAAPMGNRGLQLLVDKRLKIPRDDAVFGRVYVNNNVFAYKNVLGSANSWQPFMPSIGNIAYPHLNHFGMLSPALNNYQTFARGTWAPLLAPYFGEKTVIANNSTAICPDDIVGGPGELAINITSFNAFNQKGGIKLIWEAISMNNDESNFIIERAEAGNEDVWTKIDHIADQATALLPKSYDLFDADVVSGKTYRYRVYNMDADGSITCQNSHVVTISYNSNYAIDLQQNNPNPFSGETNIDVTIPESQHVTIEIMDIFGKVVKTLANNELLQGSKRYTWNGRDNDGLAVTDGHYIYRLTAGNETITKKMSLIRAK